MTTQDVNNFRKQLVPGMKIPLDCMVHTGESINKKKSIKKWYTIKEIYSHHCICETENGLLESLTIQEVMLQRKM